MASSGCVGAVRTSGSGGGGLLRADSGVMEGGGDAPLRLLPAMFAAVGGRPFGVYWVAASAVWGFETGVWMRSSRGDGLSMGGLVVVVVVAACLSLSRPLKHPLGPYHLT